MLNKAEDCSEMLLPSSCVCFGPPQNLNVTAGTSQTDQAQNAEELKRWVQQQQEETLRALYGEEVELAPSPLLLEELEECFGGTDWAAMDFVPGRSRSSPARSSAKRRRPHRKRSTPAAAAPADLVTSSAASPELATPTAAPAESSPPPPAAAESPAGFSSCPGRPPCWRAATSGKVRVGASYVFTEGPPATASSRQLSPAWVQSGPEIPREELMRLRVMDFAGYLRVYPEALVFVHLILEAEFLGRGWLDAPAPLSAGGPFAPLLEAVSAAAGLPEPQPAAAGSTGPQPAATPDSGGAHGRAACTSLPCSRGARGRAASISRSEHLLGFLWGDAH
ncbi:hypothetical protein ATANTOWER_015260 [Ataeniobius toweri]|uniref:Uncharacterized protein n=1 Tax=Ataeniobius toweri TaxID=208326 RepID=A0ABU7AZU4_9TELE|nr:hypothetical protein [Ataeniobius toweri]